MKLEVMRPPRFPILDDHFHLDPKGKRWKAVSEFKRSGGTHLILVSKPYFRYPYRTLEDYRRIYDTTLRLAKEAEERTGVKVFVAVGPHPADMTENMKRGMELETVKELMKEAIDLAGKYVQEGWAVAIGEVGRPHYEVPKRVWRASNEVMEYAFQVAKEIGCAVILHTESASPKTFKELASRAEKIGIKKEKVVKHFSPPLILEKENFGLTPSVISMDNLLKVAISKGNRFMMETDYIDDPMRPGAVLGPRTVPRKTYKMLERGDLSEEDIWKIHSEVPKKAYGVEVELRMEVEVKGKFPEGLKPEEMGWGFLKEIWEEDVYFQHPCRDLGETDEALRVRFSEGRVELTYKGPKVDSITKSREEISCETSEEVLGILERLGFKPVGKVKKRRRIYRKGELFLFLDEVWGEAFGVQVYLGKYLEIEGIGEYEELVKKVLEEAKKLGVSNFERRSYLELVIEKVKLSRS